MILGTFVMKTQLRNVAVSAGAYYFSLWVTPLLAWGFWKLLSRPVHPYRGDFVEKMLMPLAVHLPAALVAVAIGALVVWLVESQTPVSWAALPAALFAYFGYTGHHWSIQPSLMDRIGQVIGALFPALACIGGAIVVTRKKTASHCREDTEK
jgi:hypothetical protein